MDVGTKIAKIKDIIQKTKINIIVEWTKGKPKITRLFIKDSVLHLITIYYRKAEDIRKNIDQ